MCERVCVCVCVVSNLIVVNILISVLLFVFALKSKNITLVSLDLNFLLSLIIKLIFVGVAVWFSVLFFVLLEFVLIINFQNYLDTMNLTKKNKFNSNFLFCFAKFIHPSLEYTTCTLFETFKLFFLVFR